MPRIESVFNGFGVARRALSSFKSLACGAIATACLVLGANNARADVFTLDVNNSVEDILSFGIVPIAVVTGPTGISGTIVVDATINAGEVTSLQILSGDLTVQDVTLFGDFLFLGTYPGTLSGTFTGVHFSVSSGPLAVNSTFFETVGVDVLFDQGTLDFEIMTDLTGPVGGTIDFDAAPQTLSAFSASRVGNVLFDGSTLQLYLPLDTISPATQVEGLDVFFLVGSTLSTTTIPETSTVVMAAMGLGLATILQWKKRRIALSQ